MVSMRIRKQQAGNYGIHLAFSFTPFYSVWIPAHWMIPSMFIIGLPLSVQLLWKFPQRKLKRCVSRRVQIQLSCQLKLTITVWNTPKDALKETHSWLEHSSTTENRSQKKGLKATRGQRDAILR